MPDGVVIRPEERTDAAGSLALEQETHPWMVASLRSWQHRFDSVPEQARIARWVALDGDTIVARAGAALNTETSVAGAAWAHVTVAAAARRRGLGAELCALIEEHLGAISARSVSAMATDPGDGGRFARTRGFERMRVEKLSRVDPRDVRDPIPELAGFRAVALAEFRDRAREIYELDSATMLDVPNTDPIDTVGFELWLSEYWEHPHLDFDGSTVVVAEERPVAIAILRVAGDRADNAYTATLREFRGRGLARLAKLRSLHWAAEHGVTSAVTSNDATNAPLLAINTRLGYRPFAARVEYRREL